MKNLGSITDSKDLTTKGYVDGKDSELDIKLYSSKQPRSC